MVRQIGKVTTIPMIFAAGPVVGFFIGQAFDTHFHTDPWGKTGFALLGFIAGIKQSISIIKDFNNEAEKNGQDKTE